MTANMRCLRYLMQSVYNSVYRNLATFRQEGSFKAGYFALSLFGVLSFIGRKRPMDGLDGHTRNRCEQAPSGTGI